MGHVIVPLALVMIFGVSGFGAWRWIKLQRAEDHRSQARLRFMEGQLALLRAMLRISQAEYLTRRQMQAELPPDVFANPTTSEEPDEWR